MFQQFIPFRLYRMTVILTGKVSCPPFHPTINNPHLSNVLCSDQEFIHSSSFKPPLVTLLSKSEILRLSLLTEHLKINIGVCASIAFITSLNHDTIVNFCGITSHKSSQDSKAQGSLLHKNW